MTDCVNCGRPLPAGSRKDRRTCSGRCRIARFRAPEARPIADDRTQLWCAHCDRPRPFGRLDGDVVVLAGGGSGGFVKDGDLWRWSIYGRGAVRAPLPATVACPGCRGRSVTPLRGAGVGLRVAKGATDLRHAGTTDPPVAQGA